MGRTSAIQYSFRIKCRKCNRLIPVPTRPEYPPDGEPITSHDAQEVFLGDDLKAKVDLMRTMKRGLPDDALAYAKWMCPKCRTTNVAFYMNANRAKRCSYCKFAVPKEAMKCPNCGASSM